MCWTDRRTIAVVSAVFAFPVVLIALTWLDPLAARAASALGLV